jgi:regulator of sigma E protease
MNFLIAFFLVGLVILFHEFGHFVAARIAGIPISIFSIGFGPRLIGITRGQTEYRLSLIPLGGYVLPGVESEEEYFRIPVNQRIVMSIGGPAASLILPFLCFSLVNWVEKGPSLTHLIITPLVQLSNLLYQMSLTIPLIFQQPDQLSGIVGIVAQGGSFIGNSILNGLLFTALISLNLALLNLLPIPALDGGKILLYMLEKITPKFSRLHFPLAVAGWILVLGLMLYVTAIDLQRLMG